ncbi:hypothetical protein BDV38DRAFT_279250 [Aspergillus pseudotamarii]|uniref:Uncharacterized protein n=1 Tax=Aspergillus pseudotamarii TaxID=132259 RepID=A0A5N6T527_ASPPS|nr:uncharacterized protein BDV38DRAFT_279250 [Aspergillus pseudotamarii]KAE8141349.1 hypothetical protein BDV38DRAFT_279250 [Aspergillus pseudotamarii]
MPQYFNEIPRDRQAWQNATARAGVTDKTLRGCQDLGPGSQITETQFLLFRTICPPLVGPQLFNPDAMGLNIQAARVILNSVTDFQNYINVVGTNQWHGLETFRTTLIQQWEVLQGDLHRQNPLIAHDENSVNSSLLSFLQAIVSFDPNRRRMWRSKRLRLTGNFGTVASGGKMVERKYVAITDGQLQEITNSAISSIAECKVSDRYSHSPAVDMQEVAQVVAWVNQYPDTSNATTYRRDLVSADGRDIFISFAEYDSNWAYYIQRSRGVANAGLMRMRRFGPWKIDEPQDMRQFAKIALAVAMRQ